MDIIKVNPTLSLFQRVLLDGVRLGVLTDREIERMKEEGTELVQATAGRFFPAVGKEESYQHAVKMVSILLSFALAQNKSEEMVGLLTNLPLGEVVKIGLGILKKMDTMPTSSLFPPDNRVVRELRIIHQVALDISGRYVPSYEYEKLERKGGRYNPTHHLDKLLRDLESRKEYQALLELTEYIVRLKHKGNYHAAVAQEFNPVQGVCELMIASYLFSTVFGLDAGYRLTADIAARAAHGKRPTLEVAVQRLMQHREEIRHNLRKVYDRAVESFAANRVIKDFFGSRKTRVENLIFGPKAVLHCWRIFGEDELTPTLEDRE